MDKDVFVNILYDELSFCGCFDYDIVLKEFADVLEWAAQPIDDRKSYTELYTNPALAYIILGVLNDANLIEHGCAIRHPWITEKGEGFLCYIKENKDALWINEN